MEIAKRGIYRIQKALFFERRASLGKYHRECSQEGNNKSQTQR
jgi:hypothetical protein